MFGGKKTLLSATVILLAVFLRNTFKNVERTLKAPVIEVRTGKLQGTVATSRDGKEYYEYLNIPFAKKPTGELRFEPPEPAENWDGVRDATEYGNKCMQFDLFLNVVAGDEDCLQLNVFTPSLDPVKLKSVLVWFHGGIFQFGSAVTYRPYFVDEDVVVVTVNYRLASFGFLNTGDGLIRGNMGLKDQTMSLKWIQENISKFGGNPQSVTIFGESAGGASTHFHMLSPMSKGLFHKVISQSGLASMPWALMSNPKKQADRFAEMVNCTWSNEDDPKGRVACLKGLPASEIVNAHAETMDPLRDLSSVFVPTVEENVLDGRTFLPDRPLTLMREGRVAKVPLMTGVVGDEGLINSAVIFRNSSVINLLKTDWEKWIPRLLYLPDTISSEILQTLRDFYLENTPFHLLDSFQEFENFTHMFSDRFWNTNLHNGVTLQLQGQGSKRAPVYLYYYNYDGDFSLTNFVLALKGDYHPVAEVLGSIVWNWVQRTFFGEEIPKFGVCHGDDVPMQFHITLPLMPFIQKGQPDYAFSKGLVKLFADFAKAPVTSDSDLDLNLNFMGSYWPAQGANETLKFMKLDSSPAMITSPFEKRVGFWNSLLVDNWYPEL